MTVYETLAALGLVPVVVLEDAAKAVPTAEALLQGGIGAMEITLRTDAALGSIQAVAQNCPSMLVGAGTVTSLAQCQACVEAGARFIVSPGFDEEVVSWCIDHSVAVIPGCVTPSEITRALALGLHVVKFFPANVFGGISALKALAAPFRTMKFVPTGGVNAHNLSEFAAAPFVYAVGGSWMCTSADIAAGNFEKITQLSREAVQLLHGFEVAHVGINAASEAEASQLSVQLSTAFGFPVRAGASSFFASDAIEIMKTPYLGAKGHIAIRCNQLPRAVAYLESLGYHTRPGTEKYKANRCIAVYLQEEWSGFAIHLLQK